MHFGIFCLMNQRSSEKEPRQILAEAVEQVQAAEAAGFEIAWFAEHHFSNYSLAPSPLMMVAHVAPTTSTIRLGTGVVVLPLYHPARLLAEIGLADCMSDGRLILGIGSGYQPFEFERFGLDLSEATDRTLEMLDLLEKGLTEDSVSYNGKYIQQADAQINIRPLQNRKPDIWIAGGNSDLLKRAAIKNYAPIVTGRLFDADFLVQQRNYCAQHWSEAGKDPTSMRFSTLGAAHVCDTSKDAHVFADNLRFQSRLAFQLRHKKEALENGMLREEPIPEELSLDQIINNLIIGDIDICVERCINIIESVRPTHMALYFGVGNVPHSKTMQSIERFGSEVILRIEKELGPLKSVSDN